MARVIISSTQIEEHVNECGICDEFAYNESGGLTFNYERLPCNHPSNIDFSVSIDTDLEFEDDDLIEIEEFNELKTECDQIRNEFMELSVEHETLLQDQSSLESEYAILLEAFNKLKKEKSLWAKMAFWK